LLRHEMVDRLQVEFLIQGQQVHVQDEQVPPHGNKRMQRMYQRAAEPMETEWRRSDGSLMAIRQPERSTA
jgi:hypothetical protein